MATAVLIATMVGSAALSAVSQIQQGNFQKKIAQANAQQLEADAQRAEAAGREEARKARVRGRLVQGESVSRVLSSGVSLTGSPLEVINQNATELEFDALKAEFAGNLNANRLRRGGQIERAKGKQAQRQGLLGAGTSILQAGAQTAGAFV